MSLGVIDAFVSSERLDEVVGSGLRRDLLAWAPAVQDLRDDEEHARAFLESEAQPYLRENFDIRGVQQVVSALVAGSQVTETGQTRLRATSTLSNMVDWQVTWLDLPTRENSEVVGRLDKLTEGIREELDEKQ